MADKDLRVNLKADDDITPTARKAKAELDKIPDRVETTLDVDSTGLDDLSSKLGDLPGLLGEVGGMLTGGGGIAAGLGVGAAAAVDLAQGFADAALEARVTADLTGATIENASRLQAVWKQSGADVNDLNDVLLQMNGVLQTSPEKAAQIGVNLKDGADIGSRFVQVIGKIQDSTLGASEKAQLMAEMFGEEGVRQVAKLTASIDGPLTSAIEDVSETQVISEEEERRARKLTAATKDLGRAWADFKMTAGEILLEPVTESISKTTAVAEGLKSVTSGKFWDNSGMDAYRASLGEIQVGLGNVDTALADYRAQIDGTADTLTGANAVTDAASALIVGYAADVAVAAEAQKDLSYQIEQGVQAATDYASALDGMASAQRAAADSGFAVRDAQRDFADQLAEWVELTGPESEATMQDLAEAMDETALSAGALADSQVRLQADQLAASGSTQDAKQAQQVWNRSMLESARTAEGPLKQSIVNYVAEVNRIPPEKVSEILANPDYASIDAASAAIERAAHDREAEVRAQAVNIPPTESALNNLARPRTMTITPQLTAARNLVLPPSVSGAAMPMAATAGPATQAARATATYIPAPVVRLPTPTVVFNFNGPSLGNRFDTQRAVTKALRAHQRLNGIRA